MFGQQKQMPWAQIGTIYGVTGAMFYICVVYIWAFLNSSQGVLLAQWNEPMRYVTFFGLLLFVPLVIIPSLVLSFLGQAVTTDVRNVVMIISLPLMGLLIGRVFDYVVNWVEKSGVKRMMTPMKTR